VTEILFFDMKFCWSSYSPGSGTPCRYICDIDVVCDDVGERGMRLERSKQIGSLPRILELWK